MKIKSMIDTQYANYKTIKIETNEKNKKKSQNLKEKLDELISNRLAQSSLDTRPISKLINWLERFKRQKKWID